MSELLRIEGLSKAYPGVQANADVNLDVRKGEIHALLGENGAGKSTLVKMIYGLVRPDSGRMLLDGLFYRPEEPSSARANGVAMVFQHFSLFEALSVAENIALGMENAPHPRELSDRIRTVSREYGLTVDPNRLIGDLSVGERQRVEIVRCLLQDPKLLIMDEPTSVLIPQEVDVLFETLRKLRDHGAAILYISHKLQEIRALCDRATILRGGRVVASCSPAEETPETLAEMMVGTKLKAPKKRKTQAGDVILSVQALNLASADPFGTSLSNISFQLRQGEILGVGGVAGNGQDELMLSISGEARVSSSAIALSDQAIGHLGPNARRMRGLLTGPEERLGHAAAPDMTLTENAFLTAWARQRLTSGGFVKWPATANFARAIVKTFDVRTPGVDNAAKSLSGGNLQKFVVGREILQRPDVLVINQPTWGVDAAAAAAIRGALMDLAQDGTALLVISQDLDELMEISDTFAVMAAGRMSKPVPAAGITIEQIGLMMENVDAAA